MALNPNDFIFHSDFLYEQKISTAVLSLSVTGNIAAGAQKVVASAWQDVPNDANGIRGTVQVPGAVYGPNVSNARFKLPTILIYDNTTNLSTYLKIEVQNNKYRVLAVTNNPYDFTVASPNRTFTFYISTYLPQ